MSVLVVLLDGLGEDFLRESIESGRSKCLASIVRDGGVAGFATPEAVEPIANCLSALTGVWADRHRVILGSELDGEGRLRAAPASRRAVLSVPEIADRAGGRCLLVNVPYVGPLDGGRTVAVTERFFNPQQSAPATEADLYPPDLRDDLRKLFVPPGAITDAHLSQLAPGLVELAPDDQRRTRAAAVLARALTLQNVATALVETDDFDLVCVRFDTLDSLFAGYIDHWPKPLPYVSELDAARLAPLLPSAIELHDQFVRRLIELVEPKHVLVASGHSYWRELRRPVPIGTARSFEATPGLREAPQRPAVSREFERPAGWICWSSPQLKTCLPNGVTSLVDLADMMGCATGIAPDVLRAPNPKMEPLPEALVNAERVLDDLLELELARLPDLVDSKREQHIQDALRVEAVHARLSGDSAHSAQLLTALLRRIFDFADAARLLQALLDLRRFEDARSLAEFTARLAPGNLLAQVALAHARFGCGDPIGGRAALSLAAGIDASDSRIADAMARWSCDAVEPLAAGPFALVDHRAGAVFLLERSLEWWAALQERFAPRLALLDAAHRRLCEAAAHAPADLADRAPKIEGPLFQGTLQERTRTGSIASVSRHAEVAQAEGLEQARARMFSGTDTNEGLIALARSLHTTIYSDEPHIAGTYRSEEANAVRNWLDGRRDENGIYTNPENVARDMQRLENILLARKGVHPVLLAAVMPTDFCSIHPFVDGNGRTTRLLMQHMMLRAGYAGVRWVNMERRLDRSRSIYESTLVHSRATDSDAAIEFMVEFFLDAFTDAATRFERLTADHIAR